MPELTRAEAIRRAYLDPIRTVILVDDEFPTFDRLDSIVPPSTGNAPADPPPGPDRPTAPPPRPEADAAVATPLTADEKTVTRADGPDYERARALWGACRRLGYLCDIDDGGGLAEGIPAHVAKSDLVILDYHLQGQDPALALKLLKYLARTDHARLVVVYTRDPDLDGVRRRVASHLRGARRPESLLTGAELERWDGLADWAPTFTGDNLDAFLRGDRRGWAGDTSLRRELGSLEVPPGECAKMIEAALESFLGESYNVPTVDPAEIATIRMSGPGAARIWAQTDNLFVAFVRKTRENATQGAEVFDALAESLQNWNPSYLPMVLAYARGVVTRGGFRSESLTLADPLLQAGWLVHAVSGSEDERSDRLHGLFDRLLSRHTEALLAEISDFGIACFPGGDGHPVGTMEWLRSIVQGFASGDRWRIYHRLNEFLATQPVGGFVRTGTLFAPDGGAGDPSVVWICATPACDLVPRAPRADTWEHDLHPIRPMLALRGQLVGSGEGALHKAVQGHHVYLTDQDDDPKTVLVVDPTNAPKMELFLLEDMGRIRDRIFLAGRLSKSAEGTVQNTWEPMRALGQLRSLYANRLLQHAGSHLSRIGVDFVNLPG